MHQLKMQTSDTPKRLLHFIMYDEPESFIKSLQAFLK